MFSKSLRFLYFYPNKAILIQQSTVYTFRERMQEIRRQKEKLEEKIMDIYRTPGHSPAKRNRGRLTYKALCLSKFI